jgi:hypothetical protein
MIDLLNHQKESEELSRVVLGVEFDFQTRIVF